MVSFAKAFGFLVIVALIARYGASVVAAIVVARRSGLGRVPATNLATTILARGEFSLIIAALGAEAGRDARVVPFVAGYVLVLALAAPILAAQSGPVARCVPRRLVRDPG